MGITESGLMGCYLPPSGYGSIVIFGCGWGLGDVHEWDVANNSTDNVVGACPSGNKGMKFHVMDDGATVLTTSAARNIYSFDPDNIGPGEGDFTLITNSEERFTVAHNPSMAMLSPRRTGICNA